VNVVIRINTNLPGIILGVSLVVGLFLPAGAADAQPREVLQRKIDQSLAVLNQPPCRTEACREDKEERLWQISLTLIDYATMSRMVLAADWQTFTAEEQRQFVEQFAAFLRRTYLPVLLDRYNGEQVEYVRQVFLSAKRARVDAIVRWRERQVPISVKMIFRNAEWKIYDVSAVGISAVRNYRAQFREILRQNPPAHVIEILKNSTGRSLGG
jgi:phospholipid transport system substrate-binding protein